MYDVLIVGAGPAGAATAVDLARAGRRVAIVEREIEPGRKACGELLTPRGVACLAEMGVDATAIGHRIDHVRLTFGGAGKRSRRRSSATRWPDEAAAAVVPRAVLDATLVERATAAGAELLTGHTALEPVVNRGFVRGARVSGPDRRIVELAAGYTVVADGANSRFGRALGTFREREWPHAVAHRARFASTIHDAAEIEIVLGLRDHGGTPVTGYGFMFPRGDGSVNVGVIAMSTSPSFRVLSLPRLLEAVVAEYGAAWHLVGGPIEPAAGGRLPMGASVGPVAGPTYLVVGDAAGVANPLSGAGIEYALETGRLAAGVLGEALDDGSATALQRYPRMLDDAYGTYFKVGRLTSRMLGNTEISVRVARLAATRRPAADAFLRIAANQLRSGWGIAESAYRVGRAIALVAPNS